MPIFVHKAFVGGHAADRNFRRQQALGAPFVDAAPVVAAFKRALREVLAPGNLVQPDAAFHEGAGYPAQAEIDCEPDADRTPANDDNLASCSQVVLSSRGMTAMKSFIAVPRCLSSLPTFPLWSGRSALHVEQFVLEDQRGVWGNDASGAACAVAERGWNDEGALAADLHCGDSFVPAGDDLALADGKLERLHAGDGAVELLAFGAVLIEPARRVHDADLAGLWCCAGADLAVRDL